MPSTILRPYQKLPIVVGSFKSAVSKIIHLLSDGDCFQWQRSFYDEIIKSESHLNNARQYIWDNPSRWDRDHNIITEKMFRK